MSTAARPGPRRPRSGAGRTRRWSACRPGRRRPAGRAAPARPAGAGLLVIIVVAWSGSTATPTPTTGTAGHPDRRDLLRDGDHHHHRLRRHHPGRAARPGHQRDRGHPVADPVPGAVGRHHLGGAGQPGPPDVQGQTLEETDAQSRRGRRVRHQGPERRRHPGGQRDQPGPGRDHRQPAVRRSATPTCAATPPSRAMRPGGRSCAGPRSSRPAR